MCDGIFVKISLGSVYFCSMCSKAMLLGAYKLELYSWRFEWVIIIK